jgi:hypothetical protein
MTHTTQRPTPADDRVIRVAPGRSLVGTAIQVVILLLLLSILAAVVFVLFAVMSLVNVPGQVAGGVSTQLGGVASQASRAVSSAQQALQNATDPNHPPTGLTYDNEFNSLQVWHVGDGLPGGTQYVLTVQSIKRRDSADSPDTALYTTIHAELRQPHETRILGQLIRSDSDPHDYVVYKGETFRIGRALYRVNWISQAENAIAAATYRNPDTVSAPLKFDYP